MKKVTAILAALSVGLIAQVSVAAIQSNSPTLIQNEVIEHGGGCRKSSPPGMCCHMDNRTGLVHCH